MAKVINIMVIGYWPLADNLTTATIVPWLQLMQQDENVQQVIFLTIERSGIPGSSSLDVLSKIIHYPLVPSRTRYNLLSKISEFIAFPEQIADIARRHSVEIVLAHGALAGALAYKVYTKIKLPFYVSSFEPHAKYMAESGVWQYCSLKYQIQKYWEGKQQKYASGLITVSEHYYKFLLKCRVVAAKVKTVQSPVDLSIFKFDSEIREQFRSKLTWQAATIGIYTGKYGDLYYNEEAFQVYRKCFDLIPAFRLIILTPQPKGEILQQINAHNINPEKVYIASVAHHEVPMYLSAADLAFATIKAFPSAKYCSPVKIGEYWANGLPVLLTEGVGDDSDIIKNEGGGALFNLKKPGSVEKAIRQIQTIVQDPKHRQEIPKLAAKYRSPEQVREAYEYFFKLQSVI